MLINIDVPDLERAVVFYTAAFELNVRRRLGEEVIELAGADAAIFLLQKPAGSQPFKDAPQMRDYSRHWSGVHLDFVVADLERAVARAQRAGATLEVEPRTFDWGSIALMADPFGHGFCLLEFDGRGYAELE